MSDFERGYVDAKVEATDAKTDAKLSDLRADLDKGLATVTDGNKVEIQGVRGEIQGVKGKIEWVKSSISDLPTKVTVWCAVLTGVLIFIVFLLTMGEGFSKTRSSGADQQPPESSNLQFEELVGKERVAADATI